MFLNASKPRISNVNEILNRASLQLKGASVASSPKEKLSFQKKENTEWKNVENVSDISLSDIDSSHKKNRGTSKFLKKNRDLKAQDISSTNGRLERKDVGIAIVGTSPKSSKIDKRPEKAPPDDFNIDMISLSDSEETDSSLRQLKAKKSKFMRKENNTNCNNDSNGKPDEKPSTASQLPKPSTRLNVKPVQEVLDVADPINMQNSLSLVSEQDSGKITPMTYSSDEKISEEHDSSEDGDEIKTESFADDDIFGNVQEIGDLNHDVKSASGNTTIHTNKNSNVHKVIKETFAFNANGGNSGDDDSQKVGKSIPKKTSTPGSMFHASQIEKDVPKKGKKVPSRKVVKEVESIEDDVEDNSVVKSILDDDIASSIKTESLSEFGRSIHSRYSSGRSSSAWRSKSSRTRGSLSSEESSSASRSSSSQETSHTSRTSHTETIVSHSDKSIRKNVKLVNVEVQTAPQIEHHWLFEDQQSIDRKKKFLNLMDGRDALKDLTAYAPAMSCLNSIIKQQVSLLVTFIATQKAIHKQVIESTNRKPPYRYTCLGDMDRRALLEEMGAAEEAL